MFRRFSGIRTVGKEIIPISEECVLRAVLGGSEVIILDTLTGDVSTVKFPGEFIACNSKCQLITTLDSHPYSIVLWKDQTVLWEKYWPSSGYSTSFSLPGIFSPADQFFVISGEGESVYVLDAFSGNTLHMLWNGNIRYCKFVSDEQCVIHTYEVPSGNCLRLFNVRSGQQLSVLDIDNRARCLASCPGKGLVAFALPHSKHTFRVIQVKFPRERKDSRKIERLAVKEVLFNQSLTNILI